MRMLVILESDTLRDIAAKFISAYDRRTDVLEGADQDAVNAQVERIRSLEAKLEDAVANQKKEGD